MALTDAFRARLEETFPAGLSSRFRVPKMADGSGESERIAVIGGGSTYTRS